MVRAVSKRLVDTKDSGENSGKMTDNDLLKRLEKLEKQNATLKNRKEKFVPEEDEPLKADTYIEVVSLCPTILTLSTEPKGRGINYTWNDFGQIRQIIYSDLQKIIQNHGSGLYTDFIRKGYVYINHPEVIKKSGLKEVYEKLLTKKQVDVVLQCEAEVKGVSPSINFFESTIKSQQLLICTILIDRIARGAVLDLNILARFSRTAGCDIVNLAEEAKSYLDMNLKQSA